MSELVITTNNHPRDIIYGFQLSQSEREQFDYVDWTAIDNGQELGEFVRYRGDLIDLSQNEIGLGSGSYGMPRELEGWHGYQTESFFSGIVWRYPVDDIDPVNRDGDIKYDWGRVIIGQYYVKG